MFVGGMARVLQETFRPYRLLATSYPHAVAKKLALSVILSRCVCCFFSRKHGEGFFRWVHLNCSHESHYKVSLQGIIIMKVNARSHCKESLQGVIARSHGKDCNLHLTPCTCNLHLTPCTCNLTPCTCNLHLTPCTWLLALGSLHLAPCTCNLHLTPCTCDLHLTPCTWLLATCNGSHDSLQ